MLKHKNENVELLYPYLLLEKVGGEAMRGAGGRRRTARGEGEQAAAEHDGQAGVRPLDNASGALEPQGATATRGGAVGRWRAGAVMTRGSVMCGNGDDAGVGGMPEQRRRVGRRRTTSGDGREGVTVPRQGSGGGGSSGREKKMGENKIKV